MVFFLYFRTKNRKISTHKYLLVMLYVTIWYHHVLCGIEVEITSFQVNWLNIRFIFCTHLCSLFCTHRIPGG